MDLALSDCFQSYQAYGLSFTSNLPLAPWLGVATQSGNLVIEAYFVEDDLYTPDDVPLFSSNYLDSTGQPLSCLYRTGEILYLKVPSVGGFFIEEEKIHVQIQAGKDLVIVCAGVLSYALTLWLERHQIRCLHAAALSFHGRAGVLMADSATGKSTLVAALLQMGAEMLSDDITPLTEITNGFLVSPAYPVIRLSMPQVKQFLGKQADLAHWFPALGKALVPIGVDGWGAYCNTLQKLQCTYILERNSDIPSGEIKFESLSKTESVLSLIRFSFGRRSPLALGMATERMAFFARLVEQMNVVRLTYPSGYEHLAEVARRIIQDIDKRGRIWQK